MSKEITLKLTPRKIYIKSDKKICTLCGKVTKRFCKIFSKPGKKKCLKEKILISTGIDILESDNLSDILCQNCERFIMSIMKFRNDCLKTQYSLSSSCSVKRVISPEKDSLSMQNNYVKSSSKKLNFHESSQVISPNKNTITIDIKPFSPLEKSFPSFVNEKCVSVQHFPTSTPRLIAPKVDKTINFNNNDNSDPLDNSQPSSNKSNDTSILFDILTKEQIKSLQISINTKLSSTIAETIYSIPSVMNDIKNLMNNNIENSCTKLCSKINGSVLGNTNYTSLSECNIENIWNEFVCNFPYLVEILKIFCRDYNNTTINHNHKIKLSFIYAILLNTRWSKLSQFQRINTVLMIESGCSKKVYIIFIQLVLVHLLINFSSFPN